MIKFIEDLEKEMLEEADAHDVYMELANRAATLRHPSAANTLRNIAADEERHNKELKSIILTLKSLSNVDEGSSPHRLFPKTYADWADLGADIKEADPNLSDEVNDALCEIAGDEQGADNAKRYLVDKAGKLGIT